MRVGKNLKQQASARQQARRMNELHRVVTTALDQLDKPDTFYATSGTSQVEKAADRWLPHDLKPVIGFTPNR